MFKTCTKSCDLKNLVLCAIQVPKLHLTTERTIFFLDKLLFTRSSSESCLQLMSELLHCKRLLGIRTLSWPCAWMFCNATCDSLGTFATTSYHFELALSTVYPEQLTLLAGGSPARIDMRPSEVVLLTRHKRTFLKTLRLRLFCATQYLVSKLFCL